MPVLALITPRSRPRVPQRIRRWRFPAGTIHLVGGGFRWERIEDEGLGGNTLLSGPLEISRGVGYLGAADLELPVNTAGDPVLHGNLPEFRLCHVFYDTELADRGDRGFGPWFCLCGCRGSSLHHLRSQCALTQGRVFR